IGALATWVVEIIPVDGPRETAAVHGGFISISDDNVTILSDLAELASGIDVARAQAAAERAEVAVQREDDAVAVAALARAHARLRAAGALV
ncbi:MAG: F0F1 ATP synthase subunit epsilon, partial [Acidimicrobiales bacterium]